MRFANIDSASIYQVVDLFTCSGPEASYPWAWRSAVEVTCSLVELEHARLASSPAPAAGARGLYGQLTAGLADIISRAPFDQSTAVKSRESVKRWFRRNPTALLDAYKAVSRDHENIDPWLDFAVKHAWPEHAARLGGLFDRVFIPEIALTIGMAIDELEDLWRLTADPRTFTRSGPRTSDDVTEHIKAAYLISALLRGRYHDAFAKASGAQVLHHPLRKGVLSRSRAQPEQYCVTNTDRYFAKTILLSAFSERAPTNRILRYVDNLRRARGAFHAQSIDLRPKDFEDVAVGVAVESARKVGIDVAPRWVGQALDATFSLGVGVLTSFVLSGWAGLAATGAGYAVSKSIASGGTVGNMLYSSRWNLQRLALAGPGRIEPRWSAAK